VEIFHVAFQDPVDAAADLLFILDEQHPQGKSFRLFHVGGPHLEIRSES